VQARKMLQETGIMVQDWRIDQKIGQNVSKGLNLRKPYYDQDAY